MAFSNEKQNIHSFIKPVKSKLFKYYLVYLFLLCSLIYFYDFYAFSRDNESNEITSLKNQTIKIKSNKKFTYLSSSLLNIYEKSKEKKVFLNSLDIKNAKIIINLNSKNKKSIYNFLNEFKDATIDTIYFDEKIKRFITNASFKIHRR